jgi:AraC-like DNA-binding protein
MTHQQRAAKRKIIVQLRSQLEWSWKQIAQYVGYHEKSCQKIFRQECAKADGSYVLEQQRKRFYRRLDEEVYARIWELLEGPSLVRGDPRVGILRQLIEVVKFEAATLGLGRQPSTRARKAPSPISESLAARDRRLKDEIKQIDIRFNEIFGRPA